jgi:methylated-DNA-[protein]-cysteine S-methyltransferase
MTEPTDLLDGGEKAIADRLVADAHAGDEPPQIADAAHRDGLVDVAFTVMESGLGPLLLAATPRGLVRVSYLADREIDDALEEIARQISPRVLRHDAQLADARRQLDEYLAGSRERFDLEVDLAALSPFTRGVLDAASRIPFGQVRTYTQVAAEAGSPKGARAAGNALGSNPVPIVVPCHRVVRAGGHLGGYTGGLDIKERLLRLEGVIAA